MYASALAEEHSIINYIYGGFVTANTGKDNNPSLPLINRKNNSEHKNSLVLLSFPTF